MPYGEIEEERDARANCRRIQELTGHGDGDPETGDDEIKCQEPCDPDVGCPHCSEYWQRMEHEGFWDRERHRWTDRGWREILKP